MRPSTSALAGKTRPREKQSRGEGERQRREHGNRGDAQAEEQRLAFGRREDGRHDGGKHTVHNRRRQSGLRRLDRPARVPTLRSWDGEAGSN